MTFKAYAKSTVTIAGLEVQHDTLGQHHTFRLQDRECTILLPGPEKIAKNGVVQRTSWQASAPDDLTRTWFAVREVMVSYVLPKPIHHDGDESTFNSPEIAASRWGQNARKEIPVILASVFDHWLRVVRSATVSSTVRSTRDDSLSFQGGFRVCRVSDDRLFSGYGGMAIARSALRLTALDWNAIQSMFDQDYTPPIWLDYLLDGMHRLREEDLTGAVVSTVIACETVVRAIFWSHVPKIQNETANQIIDSFSIQSLFSRLERLTGVSKADWDKAGKKDIHKLFDLRNAIVHRGEFGSSNQATVAKLIDSAKLFVIAADGVYRGSRHPVVGIDRPEIISISDESSNPHKRRAEIVGPHAVALRDAR